MLPTEALREMKVLFCTPCYAGQTTSVCTVSVYALAGACGREGLLNGLFLHSESLVPRARNKVMSRFLGEEDYTHLFWIDADLMFSPAAAFRLLLSGYDVVAGSYPLKQYSWPTQQDLPPGARMVARSQQEFDLQHTVYPIRPVDGSITPDGFTETIEATTGFMCIKREVFVKMMDAYPDLQYVPDKFGIVDMQLEDKYCWALFDTMIEPETRRYLSEDFAFCYRWRALGGKIWVDFESKLNHVGQHLFHGDLRGSLEAQGLLGKKAA